MAYTAGGAQHAERQGMDRDRITVLNNTIDISGEVVARVRAQFLTRVEIRQELESRQNPSCCCFSAG
jgi:hypothetical protein